MKRGKTENKCRSCFNFFITHDQAKPYGCRALAFKSKRYPAIVVFETSGLECQLFKPKKGESSGGTGGIIA